MVRRGARTLTVPASATVAGTPLLGGPLRLCGWSLNDGVAGQDNQLSGNVAAPGAGANIVTLALANGVYTVNWTFELTGTPGAADVDNVVVKIGGAQIQKSVNLGVVGNYGPFTVQAVVSGGPLTLFFQAIGAATAGTNYAIKATVTPVGNSLGTIQDGQQAIGFTAIPQGSVDTEIVGDVGVEVQTNISVLATQGAVSGILWYYLESDLQDPPPGMTY